MKKIIIAAVVVLLLAGAGGGWYVMQHRGDPIQNAQALLKKGDVRAAAIELRNAVRDTPSNAHAHALLSEVQAAQGDPIASEKEIKTAERLGWAKIPVQMGLARAYLGQSKWREILDEIPNQADTPEATAVFLTVHALAHRGLNDPAAAKADITEAERVAPRDAEVRVVAARLALAQQDSALALQELDQAIESDPKKTEALGLKAQLVAAGGDRDGAIALLDQAIPTSPNPIPLRLDRASLQLSQQRDAKAKEDVDAILAAQPNNIPAQYVNMVLFARLGKFADANLVLQKLDPVIAQFPRGPYFKAMIKASVGQMAQAEESITGYVSRNPNDVDGVRLLARIELAARRPAQAIPVLARTVQAGQSDTETLDLLGRAYAMAGQRVEAEQAFKNASAATGSPVTLTRIASSRLQVGDLAGAATDLERSLEITPAQPGAAEALVATAIGLGDLDRAQQALDRLRQQAGETETVGILGGLIKLASLDQDGALAQFADTANRFPNAVAPKLNQAKILAQLGRSDEAIAVTKDLLDRNPANSDALTLMVQLLSQANRNDEAVAAVERAQAAAPTSVGIIAGHAELLARIGNPQGALAVLEAAKVNGTTPPALLPMLIRVQAAAGQTDAAKASAAALVAAAPDNIAARRAQVDLLIRLKDYGAARQAASDGLQKAPGDPALMNLIISAELQDKGFDAGMAMAERQRANPANMPNAATLKGDLYMGARRFSDAVTAYSEEYQSAPSTALVVRLAGALQAAGDTKRSTAELRKWLDGHPKDADVAQLMASSDISARHYADAERNLQIVLEQRPNDIVALNNLAWVYQTQGDRRARTLAQRAYNQGPNPEVADTLGWIMVSQGEAAKALPLLQQTVSARPDNRSAKYHLAVALKDVNRKEDAVSILRPIVSDPADFEEKAAANQLLTQLNGGKR
ncbi:MAG: tetratricopeptide repeat protein [Acetobacteraceae bacterium]